MLTIVILVGTPQPAPLDDPDPARQRTGVPIPAEAASVVAGLGLPGDPMGTRPVVVAFDRSMPDAARLRAWTRAVPSGIGVVLVVPRGGTAAGLVPVVADPRGKVADSLRMPLPVDAGPPVGYAIVDRQARVRTAPWTRSIWPTASSCAPC